MKPPTYDGRRYSVSWAVAFCVRYSISTQAKNNVKVKSLLPFTHTIYMYVHMCTHILSHKQAHDQVDRELAIKEFHRYLILCLRATPSTGASPHCGCCTSTKCPSPSLRTTGAP